MTSDIEPGRGGQLFSEFLEEQGMLEEVNAVAVKRVIAWQLQEEMKAQNMSKAEMARRLDASSAELDQLLDPENDALTFSTLTRAAQQLGHSIRFELGTRAKGKI